jgi:lysophospholipase L1-like esterase
MRIVLLVVGTLVGFGALEAGLQLVALTRHLLSPETPLTWSARGTRVLTVGDSNTYAILVEPDEAYPRVLEKQWNETLPDTPIQVINLGFPGTNSGRALHVLEAALPELAPEVVTVMVGVNDFWTMPEEASPPWWKRSRVLRLLVMMSRWGEEPGGFVPVEQSRELQLGNRSVEIGYGLSRTGNPSWRTQLADNLRAIAARGRQAGTRVVFLTYPADGHAYAEANDVIRTVAASEHVPLVDLARRFHGDCPASRPPITDCSGGECRFVRFSRLSVQPECALLFPDGHPRPIGHQRAASELVAARLGTDDKLQGEDQSAAMRADGP